MTHSERKVKLFLVFSPPSFLSLSCILCQGFVSEKWCHSPPPRWPVLTPQNQCSSASTNTGVSHLTSHSFRFHNNKLQVKDKVRLRFLYCNKASFLVLAKLSPINIISVSIPPCHWTKSLQLSSLPGLHWFKQNWQPSLVDCWICGFPFCGLF